MKVVQLNIWGGKLKNEIINFLKHEDADIVCLQEVFDYGGSGYAYLTMLNEIISATDYEHSYFSPTLSTSYMEQVVEFGNAILSKKSFNNKSTIFTHGSYIEKYDVVKDDYNIRNFQHVILSEKNKNLNVINHHGYHVKTTKLGNKKSEKSVEIIDNYIEKLTGPVIVTGDFNVYPESETLSGLNSRLINLPKKNKIESTYTTFGGPYKVCDYVFVSDDIVVVDFQVSEQIVSDHKALILEFEL